MGTYTSDHIFPCNSGWKFLWLPCKHPWKCSHKGDISCSYFQSDEDNYHSCQGLNSVARFPPECYEGPHTKSGRWTTGPWWHFYVSPIDKNPCKSVYTISLSCSYSNLYWAGCDMGHRRTGQSIPLKCNKYVNYGDTLYLRRKIYATASIYPMLILARTL